MVIDSLVEATNSPINDKFIKTFYTKKEAIAEGAKFGWRHAIRIERTFETVWIVCKKDFQDNFILKTRYEVFRVPLLRWDKSPDGKEYCPVVEYMIKKI